MHNKNWDDIRYVLAVVDAGTVSGAARTLGVNHATVLRRIASFEQHHGVQIFSKSAQGYSVLPEYLPVTEALRSVQHAMEYVDTSLIGQSSGMKGVLRVTSTDTICERILPEVLGKVAEELPDLRITVISANNHLDLARSRADLTVRPTTKLPDELFGQMVGFMPFGVYEREGGRDAWIGMTGDVGRGPIGQRILNIIGNDTLSAKADTFVVAAALASRGIGRAVLPCFVGETKSDLKRVCSETEWPSVPIWVASHVDLADSPRVRTLQKKLAEELEKVIKAHPGLTPRMG